MSILAWIVLGLIAGFIASKIYVGTGQGVLMDIVLGIVGAVVGGYLFDMLGSTGVTGFNIWSMLVALFSLEVVKKSPNSMAVLFLAPKKTIDKPR